MSKSLRIRAAEARAVVRLVAKAAAMRHTPEEQRRATIDALCELLGGQTGFFIGLDEYGPGRTPVTRWADPSTHMDGASLGYVRQMRREFPTETDIAAGEIRRMMRDTGAPTMLGLAADVGWGNYQVCKDLADTLRFRDLLVPFFRFGEGNLSAVALSVHRRGDARPFGEREVRLARFVAGELRHALLAGQLGAWARPAAATLTPRQEQAYVLVMKGLAAKQIARRMGLSVHTVREHLSGMYRRLGVEGRDELMARAVAER